MRVAADEQLAINAKHGVVAEMSGTAEDARAALDRGIEIANHQVTS